MTTKEINVFGRIYSLTDQEIENYDSLLPVLEEEEYKALQLRKDFDMNVREDLMIQFIDMYFHRFAIPYFQIITHKFPSIEDATFLKEVLYYCMVGRAVDDIVDNDSKMFQKFESVLISDFYSKELSKLIGNKYKHFQKYLIESARYESVSSPKKLTFEEIENDVYIRIRYFFLLSEKFPILEQKMLKKYMGVLLGGLDLNDAIADGFEKESSTIISNNLYHLYLNCEGKILLDNKLIKYYTDTKETIVQHKKLLSEHLKQFSLFYTLNVITQ